MIWSFQEMMDDNPGEDDYWIVKGSGMYFEDIPDSEHSEMKWDVEPELDREKMLAYHARLDNGFLLFGKYFQNLWD